MHRNIIVILSHCVIHPRLAALGAPSEARDPSGIVNTSWDRLPAFCMWDLLFCVLCRCRTFYSRTVDCRSPTSSPASASPCQLKASAGLRAQMGTITTLRTNNSYCPRWTCTLYELRRPMCYVLIARCPWPHLSSG